MAIVQQRGGLGKKASSTDATPKNSLGLGHRELSLLSDLLDRAQGSAAARRNRVFARWPFRHTCVSVVIHHPGGSEATMVMASRNLSRGGISLLHNAYVHPGSRCVIMLPLPDGPAVATPGIVMYCQHRHARLHEVGARFDRPVSIRRHINPAIGTELFVFENIQPESLQGRLLLVESHAADQRIIAHHLRETRLAIRCAATAAEALAVPVGSYDRVLLNWELPGAKGSTLMKQLRDAGCKAPICFVTADPTGLLSEGMWDPPNSAMLCKPFTAAQLLQTLAELNDEQAGPTSGVANSVDSEAVARVKAECGSIEAVLRAGDVGKALDHCLEISAIAAKARLTELEESAETAIAAIAGGDTNAAPDRLRELLLTCSTGLLSKA